MTEASQQGAVEGRFLGRLGQFQLDATFALAPTGLTALVGPSGSGKSTVLRCIAGLSRLPGRLTVGGEVWQGERQFLPAHRRPVGMVFQDASLLPHLSVQQNLLFGHRRAPAPHTVKLDEVIELLGLQRLMERSPRNLSGGERQRVALGRALLSQPRLLLMDEPLSSLDADSKAEILPYLDRLHEALAIPALYVSHDMAEVSRLADHVLVMREGRIAAAPDADAHPVDDAEVRLAKMSPDGIRSLARAALKANLRPS